MTGSSPFWSWLLPLPWRRQPVRSRAGAFGSGQEAGGQPAGEAEGPQRLLSHDASPASKESWEARRQELARTGAGGQRALADAGEDARSSRSSTARSTATATPSKKSSSPAIPAITSRGNLYRPTGQDRQAAGVLCPHGHWANGRFYEAGDKAVASADRSKGPRRRWKERRYPLQARCAQLARMGCVVFHYDMVGYADSQHIAHRAGFTDAEAELRLQSFMGLQTWNSDPRPRLPARACPTSTRSASA